MVGQSAMHTHTTTARRPPALRRTARRRLHMLRRHRHRRRATPISAMCTARMATTPALAAMATMGTNMVSELSSRAVSALRLLACHDQHGSLIVHSSMRDSGRLLTYRLSRRQLPMPWQWLRRLRVLWKLLPRQSFPSCLALAIAYPLMAEIHVCMLCCVPRPVQT